MSNRIKNKYVNFIPDHYFRWSAFAVIVISLYILAVAISSTVSAQAQSNYTVVVKQMKQSPNLYPELAYPEISNDFVGTIWHAATNQEEHSGIPMSVVNTVSEIVIVPYISVPTANEPAHDSAVINIEDVLNDPRTMSNTVKSEISNGDSSGSRLSSIKTQSEIKTEEETIIKEIWDVPMDVGIQQYLEEQCEENGVPIRLALAIIWSESAFKADVISKTNDYGLMQINICNHEWLKEKLGISNFLDPRDNIKAGVYMLGMYMEKYGNDINHVIMAYQYGETGASRRWAAGINSSDYSDKIIYRMGLLTTKATDAVTVDK